MGWGMGDGVGNIVVSFYLKIHGGIFTFYIPVNTFIVCMIVYLLCYVPFSYGSIFWTEY